MKTASPNQPSLPGVKLKSGPVQGLLTDCQKTVPSPGNKNHYLCRYILPKDELLKKLKRNVPDGYFIHKIVYDIFPKPENGEPGRILYADKGPGRKYREILILADRKPVKPELGQFEEKSLPLGYLDYSLYRFKVTINPVIRKSESKKLEPIKDKYQIAEWFIKKAPAWGFEVDPSTLQVIDVEVDKFDKKNSKIPGEKNYVILEKARLIGILSVIDRTKFIQSVFNGIGRGKAFGCGLLQIAPLQ